MSDTPTPSLLSEERLAEMLRRINANYAYYPEAERRAEANAEGDFVLDVADLLADRAAYRQQVADELRGLFWPEPADNPVELRIARACNETLKCLAARLQIDLTTPQV